MVKVGRIFRREAVTAFPFVGYAAVVRVGWCGARFQLDPPSGFLLVLDEAVVAPACGPVSHLFDDPRVDRITRGQRAAAANALEVHAKMQAQARIRHLRRSVLSIFVVMMFVITSLCIGNCRRRRRHCNVLPAASQLR